MSIITHPTPPVLTWQDFSPITQWKEAKPLPVLGGGHRLIDTATGNEYSYRSKPTAWLNCLKLSLLTIPVHTLAVFYENIRAIGRICSPNYPTTPVFIETSGHPPSAFQLAQELFYSIRNVYNAIFGKKVVKDWHMKERLQDVARIILSPLVVVSLELAALYGLVSPWNGQKLYNALEILEYGYHRTLLSDFRPKTTLWKQFI